MGIVAPAEISPDFLVGSIRKRKAELERVLHERETALQDAPAGTLRIAVKVEIHQYYHRVYSSDNLGVYLKRAQDSLASALAQKDYDCRLINELKAEIKALDRLLDEYRPDKIDSIYSSLHEYRKPLIRPARLPDDDYVRRWISVEYEKKEFEENAPDYYTAKSERVRSKSEILIADALGRHNIPYHYEYPIQIPGIGTIHPDFFCLNVRKRQVYIWEHNGMMSDPEYAENAINRIEKYAQAGYYPGENLILSFESSSHPLSSRTIERTINRYLRTIQKHPESEAHNPSVFKPSKRRISPKCHP